MDFPISKQEFLNVFTRDVFTKIVKETSIKETDITFSEYKTKLEDLYDKISSNNYFPTNRRLFNVAKE